TVKARVRSGLYKGSDLKVPKLHQHKRFYTATVADILGTFCRNCYPGKAKRAEYVFQQNICVWGIPQLQELRLQESQQILGDKGLPAADLQAPLLPVLAAAGSLKCIEITPSCKTDKHTV
ncbi:unnamed protein product, partial [Bubo scandiacus]